MDQLDNLQGVTSAESRKISFSNFVFFIVYSLHIIRLYIIRLYIIRLYIIRVCIIRLYIIHLYIIRLYIIHLFVCHLFVYHSFVYHSFVCHLFVYHPFVYHSFVCHLFQPPKHIIIKKFHSSEFHPGSMSCLCPVFPLPREFFEIIFCCAFSIINFIFWLIRNSSEIVLKL